MRIFLGHLVAYVAVILICAAVILWLTPGTLWFPWVLMGWGIAVATHALALLLRKTARAHLHRQMRTKLHRAPLRLCRGGAAALLRQSHRDAESLVVLLGGTRLGRGAHPAWLERLLQAATACRNDRAAEDRDDLKAEFTRDAEQAHQAEIMASSSETLGPLSS